MIVETILNGVKLFYIELIKQLKQIKCLKPLWFANTNNFAKLHLEEIFFPLTINTIIKAYHTGSSHDLHENFLSQTMAIISHLNLLVTSSHKGRDKNHQHNSKQNTA